MYIILFLFLALFVILLLSYYCIFKTEKIINLLQLDRGINKTVNLENIKTDNLLTVLIFVIGGIFITYSFSNVLISLIYTISGNYDVSIELSASPEIKKSLLLNVVDLIVGIILIINAKRISFLVNKKR